MMDFKNRRINQMLRSFAIIFVPGLLIVVVLAEMFININIENGKNIIKIKQLNNSEIVSDNVNSIFEDIKSDGNIILNSNEVKTYVDHSAVVLNRDELKRIFSNMMINKKIYDSIQFVGVDGYEKVRVNAADNRTTAAVADSELEYKGDQFYFAEGMKLNSRELFISPMDLSMNGEEVETPVKPVMRGALPA